MNSFRFFIPCLWWVFFILLLNVEVVRGQDYQPNLSSPYDAVKTHLYFLQSDTYEPEKASLPFKKYTEDSAQAVENAIKLKQVLDGMGLYVYMNKLPNQRNFTDSTTNQQNYVLFPEKLPSVYLTKENGVWVYSEETVGNIASLHRSAYPFGTSYLINLLPSKSGTKFLGIFVWQIYGLICALLLCFLSYWLFKWAVRRLFNFITNRFKDSLLAIKLKEKSSKFIKIMSLIFVFTLFRVVIALLQFPIEVSRFMIVGLRIAITVLFVLLFIQLVNFITIYIEKWTSRTDSLSDDQLVPIIDSILKLIVLTLGVIQVLRLMDVNVTALIAGVSLGGLAIALAAQDTVKNLLGSVTIFLDRPFQVGDWVVNGSIEGAIEEVGFRTTKIRTVDSSLISIPNGNIVNSAVTNMGVRQFRLYNTTIGVEYDTPAQTLESFLEGIKKLILTHPKTDHENYWVRFTTFSDSSLSIMFRARIFTNDYAEEQKVKEDLNFGILKLAESMDVAFAFPSRTIYISKGEGKPAAWDDAKVDDFFEYYQKFINSDRP
ncbi:mechanosensitive ion channel family protein [Membranihabitans maritimus]|uniref:mechanosensitive ion channel family protein n=1 Tax=Membranihabitans maritimus TaxID=2904244 RepID=UPI001F45F0FE|nr:mechanosensitive ion channel family protein [Membranihabitans maritimus]